MSRGYSSSKPVEELRQPGAHTRTATVHGPDYCAECSDKVRDWVKWPCPSAWADRVAAIVIPADESEPTTDG